MRDANKPKNIHKCYILLKILIKSYKLYFTIFGHLHMFTSYCDTCEYSCVGEIVNQKIRVLLA